MTALADAMTGETPAVGWGLLVGTEWRSEYAAADVDAARAELGEDSLVAAATDIECRSEGAAMTVASAPVTAMTMTATVHAMSATVPAMPGRSRGDSGSGQGECGDSCERNPAKHFVFSVQGVIA
jgi:hypothetical protein